jgi:hypothetical protein
VAINPFYIWHAQDGRMYSLLAMLSAASIWFGLRLLRPRTPWTTGLAYWAVTTLALLTHYFAWLVLLAENIAAAMIIWKGDRPQVPMSRSHSGGRAYSGRRTHSGGRWLAWQAAVVLTLAPWLVFASGLLTSHTSSWIPPLTPLQMLQRSLMTFSVGSTIDPRVALAFSLVMGILFFLGCLFPSQRARSPFGISGRALLLSFVGVPLLATILLSLQRPAFDEKYLIAIVAPYLILVAHGLHFLGAKKRLIGFAACVVILATSCWSLYNYHTDPAYAKSPDWRLLVESIETRAAEGDVIVENYPDPGLDYYYDGNLPLRLLPAAASASEERIGRDLEKLASSYRRIWLIPSPGSAWDPRGSVAGWLERHSDLVDDRQIGSLRLQLYHTPLTFLEEMQAVDAEFGGQIRLLGYRLAPGADTILHPGETLTLTLYWQAMAKVDNDLTVFAHLSDASDQIWGQHDGQPVDGTHPTTAWIPGEVVVDQHTIEISPTAPAGPYRLLAGLYDGATGQRLAIDSPPSVVASILGSDRLVLASVEISIPDNQESNQEGQGE